MVLLGVALCSAGLMCMAKLGMGGKLRYDCYLFLLELCNDSCWRTNPSSHFPLECHQERDVLFMVLVNVGMFFICSVVAGIVIYVCVYFACTRPRLRSQRRRKGNMNENLIGAELRTKQKAQERDDM